MRAAARVALAFRERPALLYSYGGRTEGGVLDLAGRGRRLDRAALPAGAVRHALRRTCSTRPTRRWTPPACLDGPRRRARRQLRTARLGMAGAHDMGLYTTPFDVTRLRGRIGPEVESVDLLELRAAEDELDRSAPSRPRRRGCRASWDEPFGPDSAGRAWSRAVRLAPGARFDLRASAGSTRSPTRASRASRRHLGTTHNLASSLVAIGGVPYIDENDMLNLTAQLMLALARRLEPRRSSSTTSTTPTGSCWASTGSCPTTGSRAGRA